MLNKKTIAVLIASTIPTTALAASFTQNIAKGTEVSNEVIDGKQSVYGNITNSIITTGGHQYIYSGGAASDIILNGGKSTVNNADIKNFKIINGIQTLKTGAISYSAEITGTGIQHVNDGAKSAYSTLANGGRQYINSGGKSENTTIESGGSLYTYANGESLNTTVNDGAFFVRGGAATNSVINGGKQVVTEGGITTGDIINDGGYQNIGVNGSAFNVVVNKGGRQDINTGGYAKDTTIIGGQYDIDPEATGENVSFDGGLGFVRETGILTGYATLKNGAEIYMAEGSDADISLSSQSKLYVVNDITNSNMTLDNSSVYFRSSFDGKLSTNLKEFKTLNVNKLNANNSSFFMKVEGMNGDFLNISEFSGDNNTVSINGSGKESSDGYHLIHAGNSSVDAFKLDGGKVELGSYVYTLEKNNDDWYLRQHADQLSSSAKTVLSMASYASSIFTNEFHTISDRLNNSLTDIEGNHLWGRFISSDYRVNNGVNEPYKLTQNGFEYGLGKTISKEHGDFSFGISAGITQNKIKEKSGTRSDVDSYSVGLYGSYIHKNGFYIDGLIKGNRFDNTTEIIIDSSDIATANFKQTGFGSALEFGKYTWFDNSFVTPYVRTEYFMANNEEVKISNGMKADLGNDRSLKGEAGVKLGTNLNVWQNTNITPYLKVSLEHEFIDDNYIKINDSVKINNDNSGTIGNYSLGLDAKMGKNASFYSELGYSKGSNIEVPFNVKAGVRVLF